MNHNIFLVTSAINVTSGLIGVTGRLEQTVQTARSIKQFAKNPTIILLEGGKSPLTFDQKTTLKEVYDDILDFTWHPTIQFAHNQNVHAMYIKGPCESIMLHEACKLLPRNNQYRIFKISGRYYLYDKFVEEEHNAYGKYVFLKKQNGVEYYHDNKNDPSSQLQNIDLYYTPYQYKTRLYSFCSSILDVAIENYLKIFNEITSSYVNHGYIDLEHATYKNINPNSVCELDLIGLGGTQAENAVELRE